MTTLTVHLTSSGAFVNGLADDPEVTIRRADTGAAVVSGAAMTDEGADGLYTYDFVPEPDIRYTFTIDADPNNTGQVDNRLYAESFDNQLNDLWNDHGLNPDISKTITENTPNTNYTETVSAATSVSKSVTVAGNTTTINRA